MCRLSRYYRRSLVGPTTAADPLVVHMILARWRARRFERAFQLLIWPHDVARVGSRASRAVPGVLPAVPRF